MPTSNNGLINSMGTDFGNKRIFGIFPNKIFITLAVSIVLIAIGVTFYFLNNYGISENRVYKLRKYLLNKDVPGFDLKLYKYYITKNMSEDELKLLAKNDCYEQKFGNSKSERLPNYQNYIKILKEKLFVYLDIDASGSFSNKYISVPGTDQCYIIVVSDTEGKSVIGYEDKNRDLKLYYTLLSK